MPNALGDKIKSRRKEKGFTLEKLADLTGSSKSYIWELENKAPPRPSADKLLKIADQLGVSIEYLMGAEQGLGEEEAVDAKFYRDYRKMNPDTRKRIREMTKLIGVKE